MVLSEETAELKENYLKVYMTDFFICSIKSPQCTDKYSRLGMIVMSFQDFKFREKQTSATFSYYPINNALL